ncbi:MAG: sigma-70 family RNA polymerase sigma factor [Planctomycetes bacterium]|nr:sigma-70 family RNA polymerase sigma factor [Planctomycetota bacterium]
MSDDHLETKADRGTEFVRLLKRHDRRLAAFVHSIVPDWHEADEIVQATCVRLWEQFDQYRPDGDFGAWACTVARYLVLARQKQSQRSRLYFRAEVMGVVEAETAADEGPAQRRLVHLRECLTRLGKGSRELLARCYAPSAVIKEIADTEGRSVGSLYTALSRIRTLLQRCIEERQRQEEQG